MSAEQNQRRSLLGFSLGGHAISRILKLCKLNNKYFPVFGFTAVLLAIAVNMAMAAQDKYTVAVPGGLAFSEFRGYENWQFVSVSKTEHAFAGPVHLHLVDIIRRIVPPDHIPPCFAGPIHPTAKMILSGSDH